MATRTERIETIRLSEEEKASVRRAALLRGYTTPTGLNLARAAREGLLRDAETLRVEVSPRAGDYQPDRRSGATAILYLVPAQTPGQNPRIELFTDPGEAAIPSPVWKGRWPSLGSVGTDLVGETLRDWLAGGEAQEALLSFLEAHLESGEAQASRAARENWREALDSAIQRGEVASYADAGEYLSPLSIEELTARGEDLEEIVRVISSEARSEGVWLDAGDLARVVQDLLDEAAS